MWHGKEVKPEHHQAKLKRNYQAPESKVEKPESLWQGKKAYEKESG